MISTLLFVWHKVSSLPPRTQNLNLRFHPDHEYQCPINLYTGYFRLLFCMSIKLSGYEREITMISTLILYDTPGFLPSSIYPNSQSHKYHFQLTSFFLYEYDQYEDRKEEDDTTFLYEYNHYEATKEEQPWYLLYFLYDTRFCCFLLLPKTSIWDSTQTINTSVQSTCMYAISSCYHFSVWV